jgi:diguanylate cyclase (GGDEF)-like protein
VGPALLERLRLRYVMHREKQMSRTDPLTGACNIRCFYERAEDELERSRRYGHPLSLAYLDVDNFKQVNDTLGHSTGDELLRSMSAAMLGHVRESDIVARLGGDEFCILFPETGQQAARFAMEKLRQEMHAAFPGECAGLCSFSVGLVTFVQPPLTVEEVVQVADRLMYEVKNSTKDAIAYAVYPEE